jgi:hypothetical protein
MIISKFWKSIHILFIFLVALLPISCKKDNNSNSSIQNQIQTSVQSGTWRVTKYIDSGVDETNYFTGYGFSFGSNGILSVASSASNYSGTWVITDSNSNDDTQNDLDFIISFPVGGYLESLNSDWNFISQSSVKIELIDVSGGGGGTDYLTFEKN